ncbi:MAG: hypothetical protein ABUL72_02505, partial [Armatimonadota bacterium]
MAQFAHGTPSSLQILTNPTIGGTNIVAKVFLTSPAPAGGEVVTLTSDATVSTLPTSVTVPQGATVKAFSFTPDGVDASSTFALHATSGGVTVDQNLTVNPASLISFSFGPNSVIGGVNTSGVVTLNGYAGPSGTVISLMNGSPKVVLPATATVPYNTKTKASTVITGGVASTTPTTNFAHQGAQPTLSGNLTLNPASLYSLTLNSTSVVGGNNVILTARLDGTAPAGGVVVPLSTSTPGVNLPASVTIPAGKVAGAVSFNPVGVDAAVVATLSGTMVNTKTVDLTINPAKFVSFYFDPGYVVGGNNRSGVVVLNGLAGPSGYLVDLNCGNANVSMPPNVTVLSQARRAAVTATTKGVNAGEDVYFLNVHCSGSAGGITVLDTLHLQPSLVTATADHDQVTGGSDVVVTLRLNGKSGPPGVTFTLSSNSPHATCPASVHMPPQTQAMTFTVHTTAVSSPTPV